MLLKVDFLHNPWCQAGILFAAACVGLGAGQLLGLCIFLVLRRSYLAKIPKGRLH